MDTLRLIRLGITGLAVIVIGVVSIIDATKVLQQIEREAAKEKKSR